MLQGDNPHLFPQNTRNEGVSTPDPIRILIADDDGGFCLRLKSFLNDQGFEARTARNGLEAKRAFEEFHPRFTLVDFMLPELSAIGFLDFVNEQRRRLSVPSEVLVMSNQNDISNVRQVISRGARDYIVKPFQPDDLLRRLLYHSRNLRLIQDPSRQQVHTMSPATLISHLTQLILRESTSNLPFEARLYNLTKMLNMKVAGVRCSIVEYLSDQLGLVVTSNDNREASGLEIQLNNYPEILHAMHTGQIVAIENLKSHPTLKNIADRLLEVQFNSLIVAPISRGGQPFGVLSCRLPATATTIQDEDVRFVEIVAHTFSLLLSAADAQPFWASRRRSSNAQVLNFKRG